MKIRQIKCKTALSPSKLPGLTYSLNPYTGCQHSCAYCYVPDVIKINRETWGTFVDIKINLPLILSKELRNKQPGVVGISTVTDPYQPLEKTYKITRYCLEQLLKHDFPICIQTKSSLVQRDIDLISNFSDVEVMLSIATLNEKERTLLEPFSSSINDRLETLRVFSEIGVKTSVFFGPIYPTITVETLSKILDVFKETGISYIMIDKFRMRTGMWEHLSAKLKNDPLLFTCFSKNLFPTQKYYKKIRVHLMYLAKEKNVKVVDAF